MSPDALEAIANAGVALLCLGGVAAAAIWGDRHGRRPPAADVDIAVNAAKAAEHRAKIEAQLNVTRGIETFNQEYGEFGEVIDVTRRPPIPSSYWLPFANGAVNRSSGADMTGAAAHSPEEVCNAVGHLMVWGVPACFRCKEIPE